MKMEKLPIPDFCPLFFHSTIIHLGIFCIHWGEKNLTFRTIKQEENFF